MCLAEEAEHSGSESGVNICASYTGKTSNLTLLSPGYPASYPQRTECRCMMTAERHSKVSVVGPSN